MSQEKLIEAIKAAKEYVTDLSNVCKSCENSSQVYQWIKANDRDIHLIKEEINKAYELALERCTGRTPKRYEMWSIFDILRAFEKVFAKSGWKVYASASQGPGLIENQHDGVTYYLDGWDTSKPISPSKISSKCSFESSKGRKIDKRILLARHFSSRMTEGFDKGKLTLRNVFLIDLGFRENTRGDVLAYGEEGAKDPFITELVSFIEEFVSDPEHFIKLVEKGEEQTIYPFMIRDALRLFEDSFRILDCGHLKVAERRIPFWAERHSLTLEERFRGSSHLYAQPSEEASLEDLKVAREKMINKIDQLYKSEFVTSAVKKDMEGNLLKTEMLLLCKACEDSYLNKYEIPLDPCGGKTCIFKHFLDRMAENLSYEAKYVEPYELGLLSKDNDTITVSRTESVRQPSDNIMMFKPSHFIVLDGFLSIETVEHVNEREYMLLPRRLRLASSKSDPTAIAYGYAKDYLLPTIAYDWSSDEYEYVPIEKRMPSMSQIIKTIVSIDYTVGATEKAYKAPHDRIMDIYEEMGLEFGFKPVKEYGFGMSRVDVVWLDRANEEPEVGIEVELSGQITNDLWKLCEIRPSLGVLVVKGSYYDSAVEYVTNSSIVKKFHQRLLIFDASEKNFTLIEGSKLVDLTSLTSEDASINKD